MPQFDPTVFLPQFVWLGIAFAILYFGIVRPTLPKLGRVVGERKDKVTGDIRSAEQAKAEADRMAAEYEAGVATAQGSARDRLGAAQAEAARSLEAKLHASNAELDARAAEAQASLDAARAQAMGTIGGVASDAAADIVEKLTGRRPAPAEAQAAAQAALA